ncbi:MAG: MoxR family ATPase [Chryseolinea sp.]
MKIRNYPTPNPLVPNSRSRFATGTTTIQDNGQNKTVDVLNAIQAKCPVSKFEFDKDNSTGKFVQEVVNGVPKVQLDKVLFPYIPTPDLVELVRIAQILQRPILIKGEPGSGKTQLARSVAYEWYGDNYKDHFFEWPIKSMSKAVDGLYTFDHVARLRDSYRGSPNGNGHKDPKEDKTMYREFGPLGKAFLTSTEDNPSILLIDEIDKADIDFPNDLLLELDERRFKIPDSETGELIAARYPPLIFITSNDERELPEAFLRRCLFLYIKFPDESTLLRIIDAHIPGMVNTYKDFVGKAITRFVKLRDEILKDPGDNKRVSTSELLDWLRTYHHDLQQGRTMEVSVNGKSETKRLDEVDLTNLPFFYQALLKTYQSVNRRQVAIDTAQKKQS